MEPFGCWRSPQAATHLADARNSLLELLPRKDREHLLAQGKAVELKFEEVLWQPGKPARYVYFPLTSFVSLVASLEGEPVLEVGMAGHEGALGAQLALGLTAAPLHAAKN